MKLFKEKYRKSEIFTGFLFTSPVILGILIFTYIPVAQAFYFSFCDYNGFNKMDFIGFGNYIRMFRTDLETATVFRNTFLYAAITVPLSLVLGYAVALLVNTKVKGVKGFRVLFYLPVLIPAVSSGVIWKDMMEPASGVMWQIFHSLFDADPTFFTDAKTAMGTLIWVGTWGVGGSMIIWLSAFKNIPETLYESARLDGANALQCVFFITVPMSSAMIFYNLITGIIGSLQTFNTFIIAGSTNGRGPQDSLYFIAVKIYDEAFTRIGRMGYACAYSFVLFAIIGTLTALAFRLNKWVVYAEDV